MIEGIQPGLDVRLGALGLPMRVTIFFGCCDLCTAELRILFVGEPPSPVLLSEPLLCWRCAPA